MVLAILGLLMSLVGPRVLNQLGGAKTKTALIQIKDLEQALEMYKLGCWPVSPQADEGLEALVSQARWCTRLEWPLPEVRRATGSLEARIPVQIPR